MNEVTIFILLYDIKTVNEEQITLRRHAALVGVGAIYQEVHSTNIYFKRSEKRKFVRDQ